jgi:hypothetical protein
MTDDFDHLLGPPGDSANPQLRDRLREATSRRVSRGPVMRRVALAAALAACYAGGAATMWLARPAVEQVEQTAGVNPAARPEQTAPQEPAKPEPRPEPYRSPRQLELAAEQADGVESAKLYFEAGRRYGRDFNDWPSAMRCYRNALDLSSEQPAIDSKNDDWLLVKLKTERRESHANP